MTPPLTALTALARAHLALGRPLEARAEGHSMWPFIKNGDRVRILPLDAHTRATLGPGAVVLCESPRGLILHRVIAKSGDALQLKGDGLPAPDGLVHADDLLGVLAPTPCDRLVALASRLGGRPLAALTRRLRVAIARVT
jgi:hypothetical protein